MVLADVAYWARIAQRGLVDRELSAGCQVCSEEPASSQPVVVGLESACRVCSLVACLLADWLEASSTMAAPLVHWQERSVQNLKSLAVVEVAGHILMVAGPEAASAVAPSAVAPSVVVQAVPVVAWPDWFQSAVVAARCDLAPYVAAFVVQAGKTAVVQPIEPWPFQNF